MIEPGKHPPTTRVSIREGIGRAEAAIATDDVPAIAREGLIKLLSYYHDERGVGPGRIYDEAFENIPELRFGYGHMKFALIHDHDALMQLGRIIRQCDTATFFDLVEVSYASYDMRRSTLQEEFARDFNRLAIHSGAALQFEDSVLKRRFADAIQRPIRKGLLSLQSNVTWADAESLYERAVGKLSSTRPELDNAVKDAVAAVESCLQIILGRPNLNLPDLIDKIPQGDVHTALLAMLDKLFGYRSDMKGAAHGRAGRPDAKRNEAEFAVASCGAACTMLIDYHNSRGY